MRNRRYILRKGPLVVYVSQKPSFASSFFALAAESPCEWPVAIRHQQHAYMCKSGSCVQPGKAQEPWKGNCDRCFVSQEFRSCTHLPLRHLYAACLACTHFMCAMLTIMQGNNSGIAKAFRNLPGVEVASVESLNLLQASMRIATHN